MRNCPSLPYFTTYTGKTLQRANLSFHTSLNYKYKYIATIPSRIFLYLEIFLCFWIFCSGELKYQSFFSVLRDIFSLCLNAKQLSPLSIESHFHWFVVARNCRKCLCRTVEWEVEVESWERSTCARLPSRSISFIRIIQFGFLFSWVVLSLKRWLVSSWLCWMQWRSCKVSWESSTSASPSFSEALVYISRSFSSISLSNKTSRSLVGCPYSRHKSNPVVWLEGERIWHPCMRLVIDSKMVRSRSPLSH